MKFLIYIFQGHRPTIIFLMVTFNFLGGNHLIRHFSKFKSHLNITNKL